MHSKREDHGSWSVGLGLSTLGGAFAGGMLGTGALLAYSLWRETVLRQLQTGNTSPTTELLTRWGPPPEENLAFLFPAVGLGILLGLAAYLRFRWVHRSRRTA